MVCDGEIVYHRCHDLSGTETKAKSQVKEYLSFDEAIKPYTSDFVEYYAYPPALHYPDASYEFKTQAAGPEYPDGTIVVEKRYLGDAQKQVALKLQAAFLRELFGLWNVFSSIRHGAMQPYATNCFLRRQKFT